MDLIQTIDVASVKIMRSHDYCHFEVTLSKTLNPGGEIAQVENLRKTAARLVDKAVDQYKQMKRLKSEMAYYAIYELKREAAAAEAKPEADRTPEDKAAIKALGDYNHNQMYDYEDDWSEA